MDFETRQKQEAIVRERARQTVARIYPVLQSRGLGFVDLHCALGEASEAFPAKTDKRIWVEEITRYEQEHGITA